MQTGQHHLNEPNPESTNEWGPAMRIASVSVIRTIAFLLTMVVIDRVQAANVNFTSVLGGNSVNYINSTTIDSQGNIIVGGKTGSSNLPTSPNAFLPTAEAFPDTGFAFVAKISSDGKRLIWLTYFPAFVLSVLADKDDNVIVIGHTSPSFSLPVSANAFQRTAGGGWDVFVAKLSSDGTTLIFSTLLGGNGNDGISELARPAVLSSDGTILVCGQTDSSNFPLAAPGNGSHQVFAARLSADGSHLLQVATFPGLTCRSIVSSPDGGAIITGISEPGFDITTAAGTTPKLTGQRGAADVFVIKLFSDRSSVTPVPDFVSVFGGSKDDSPDDIVIAPQSDSFFVVGNTYSQDFPVSESAYRQFFGQLDGADTFIVKLSMSDGSTLGGTFLNLLSVPQVGYGVGGHACPNSASVLTGGDVVVAGPSPDDYPVTDVLAVITISSDLTTKRGFVWFPAGGYSGTFFNKGYWIGTTIGSFDGVPQYYLGPGTTVTNGTITNITAIDLSTQFPSISSRSITSAATNAPTPISYGLVLSIYGEGVGPNPGVQAIPSGGNLPKSLAGSSARLGYDDTSLPILFAGPTQLNVSINPAQFVIHQPRNKVLYVTYRGINSELIPIEIADYAPGVFTVGGNGTGQATALNASDGSLNGPTHAAARGTIVSLFVTGLGAYASEVNSDISTAATSTAVPAVVTIGGVVAQVLYSGTAPGLVASVYQINVKIPENTDTGQSIPLVVQIGGVSSQQGVFLTVK